MGEGLEEGAGGTWTGLAREREAQSIPSHGCFAFAGELSVLNFQQKKNLSKVRTLMLENGKANILAEYYRKLGPVKDNGYHTQKYLGKKIGPSRT